MAKTKTSVTKSAIPVGTEDAPVEDQAKVTKKKGRPAKTKPAIEEPIQKEVSELAAVEQLTQHWNKMFMMICTMNKFIITLPTSS